MSSAAASENCLACVGEYQLHFQSLQMRCGSKKNMLTLGQSFDQKAENIKSRATGEACVNFLTMTPSAVCVW